MNDKKINRSFEQYKRLVKFAGSAVIVLLELAIYYYVWMIWSCLWSCTDCMEA